MNYHIFSFASITLIFLLFHPVVSKAIGQEPVRPRYERSESDRKSGQAEIDQDVPGDLVIKQVTQKRFEDDSHPTRDRSNRDSRERGETNYRVSTDRAAAEAARWAAGYAAETYGFRAYYEVGFYTGLHNAFDHRDRWDYEQGLRYGDRDPDALRMGTQNGREAANRQATEDAERDVTEQFRDLSRVPEPFRRPVVSTYQSSGTYFIAPKLDEVFDEYPLHRYDGWTRHHYRFHDGWRPNPVKLHGVGNYRRVYDDNWTKGGFGFTKWLGSGSQTNVYRDLARKSDKARFKEVFEAVYEDNVGEHYQQILRPAFRSGARDGWRYGSFIRGEWEFRRGYQEAAQAAAVQTAQRVYHRTYRDTYELIYRDAYNHWQNNVVAEIQEVFTIDGNQDGVQEPGETMTVTYRLANYGGREGRVTANLTGYGLERAGSVNLTLPARATVADGPSITVRFREDLEPNTDQRLQFGVDGQFLDMDVNVGYPIRFQGDARLHALDSFNGSATLAVHVTNAGQRVLPATVTLSGAETGNRQAAIELAPHQTETITFEVNGLDTLEILSGSEQVDFAIPHEGKRGEYMRYQFPKLAVDLESNDLVTYLLKLAADPHANPSHIQRAHGLVRDRMITDWQAAIDARGNPYRRDRRGDAGETALGRLVEAYQSHASTLPNKQVFTDLAPALENLADQLPGTHPFLRSQFIKLARQLK